MPSAPRNCTPQEGGSNNGGRPFIWGPLLGVGMEKSGLEGTKKGGGSRKIKKDKRGFSLSLSLSLSLPTRPLRPGGHSLPPPCLKMKKKKERSGRNFWAESVSFQFLFFLAVKVNWETVRRSSRQRIIYVLSQIRFCQGRGKSFSFLV